MDAYFFSIVTCQNFPHEKCHERASGAYPGFPAEEICRAIARHLRDIPENKNMYVLREQGVNTPGPTGHAPDFWVTFPKHFSAAS